MRTKNITKIIFAAVFCAALAFTSCSQEEPTAEIFAENSKGEWFAAEPLAKIAIAVDEDNYDGLLAEIYEKPTSKINIEIKNGNCFLDILNKDFADYFYIPQKLQLNEGESFFYQKFDLLNPANKLEKDTIIAKDTIDMNKSFPLVTNIAYHTLNKINIDNYTPMIEPMIMKMGLDKIVGTITQEGGFEIQGFILEYNTEMSLREYLEQANGYIMRIGDLGMQVIKNFAGEKFYPELLEKKVMTAIMELMPMIIENIKPRTLEEIVALIAIDQPMNKLFYKIAVPKIQGTIVKLIRSYLPNAKVAKTSVNDILIGFIDGAKHVQANLKSSVKISSLAIVPTKSTVSLRKLNYSDENNTLLINTMNFKFVDIKFSEIENSKLDSEILFGVNSLLIPVLNHAVPAILNNPNMLPGTMGKTIGAANDFNYTITSSITKN